jgi:hypothetical protein
MLGHWTQAGYAWLSVPVSRRDLEDAYLTNALIDAHGDDAEFGYRFLADEVAPHRRRRELLLRDQGSFQQPHRRLRNRGTAHTSVDSGE